MPCFSPGHTRRGGKRSLLDRLFTKGVGSGTMASGRPEVVVCLTLKVLELGIYSLGRTASARFPTPALECSVGCSTCQQTSAPEGTGEKKAQDKIQV